jgi:hypothetical protein
MLDAIEIAENGEIIRIDTIGFACDALRLLESVVMMLDFLANCNHGGLLSEGCIVIPIGQVFTVVVGFAQDGWPAGIDQLE